MKTPNLRLDKLEIQCEEQTKILERINLKLNAFEHQLEQLKDKMDNIKLICTVLIEGNRL